MRSIETKILRQQAPQPPRQPRIISLNGNDEEDDEGENIPPQIVKPNDNNEIAPAPSIISNNSRNTLKAAPIEQPKQNNNNNKFKGIMDRLNSLSNMMKTSDKKSENARKELENDLLNEIKNQQNQEFIPEVEPSAPKKKECGKAELNKAYKKYGIRGFNNIL